jgi:hypothetical protein
VEKVVDVVGLYHNPPEKAVVLCVDEKSQIQALDRSRPVLSVYELTCITRYGSTCRADWTISLGFVRSWGGRRTRWPGWISSPW